MSIEQHSIDFVPLSERYGTPRRLFTIWFSCNLTILGIAAGALGVTSGLSFSWAVIAIALGNALGSIFVAAHSAQGPHLGLPQMIQSRAQFGVLGAGIPLIAVILTYLLYSAADGLIIEGTLRALLPVSNNTALVIFALATLLIAFVGYELIHRMGAVLTIVSGTLFGVAAYLLVARAGPHLQDLIAAGAAKRQFNGALFGLTLTQGAAWALSYGPYVADYSRYLPPSVSSSSTFWNTGLGCFLGSTLIMSLGAGLAVIAPDMTADVGTAIADLLGPWRPLARVLLIVGVVQGNVLNLYSAYMSTTTVLSGIHGMTHISRLRKFVTMALLMVVATGISMAAQENFQAYFSDVLNAMVYLLVPWSAINLADYYLVRKGRYSVADMFRVEGEYGAYRWPTIGVFCLGVVLQVPFMSLSFFQGAVAKAIGSDIAWLPGLLIPGLLHVWVEQRRESRAEAAVVSKSSTATS